MSALDISARLSQKLIPLEGERKYLLTGGTLIDGTGRPAVADAAIVIEGERIVQAGRIGEIPIPEDATVVDTAGKVMMPGLIDCHIHLTGEVTFDAYRRYLMPSEEGRLLRAAADSIEMLETGFTTLREPGGKFGTILKRAINQGVMVGPRILAAGIPLTTTGGHGDWRHFPYEWVKEGQWRGLIVDGVDECRKAVRRQFREGADLIKILASGGGVTNSDEDLAGMGMPEFTDEELEAIIEEAHMRRAKVAAHTTGAEVIRHSVAAGIDTIEHGVIPPSDYDVLDMMAEKGVVLVPTIAIFYRTGYEGDKLGVYAGGQVAARRLVDQQKAMVNEAKRRGVTIVLGTDCVGAMGVGESALELRLLVESGLSPLEAIVAGTQNGAIAMGLQKHLGTLQPGKLADILVLNQDPLDDIRVLEDRHNIKHILKTKTPLSKYP